MLIIFIFYVTYGLHITNVIICLSVQNISEVLLCAFVRKNRYNSEFKNHGINF